MPKNIRLTGAEIRKLVPEKRLNSSLFSLSITRTGSAVGKVACVVSKKVSARAVGRNRVKRRMRAALRTLFPLPAGVALVLTAKKPATDVTFEEIRADIASLLSRVA